MHKICKDGTAIFVVVVVEVVEVVILSALRRLSSGYHIWFFNNQHLVHKHKSDETTIVLESYFVHASQDCTKSQADLGCRSFHLVAPEEPGCMMKKVGVCFMISSRYYSRYFLNSDQTSNTSKDIYMQHFIYLSIYFLY